MLGLEEEDGCVYNGGSLFFFKGEDAAGALAECFGGNVFYCGADFSD